MNEKRCSSQLQNHNSTLDFCQGLNSMITSNRNTNFTHSVQDCHYLLSRAPSQIESININPQQYYVIKNPQRPNSSVYSNYSKLKVKHLRHEEEQAGKSTVVVEARSLVDGKSKQGPDNANIYEPYLTIGGGNLCKNLTISQERLASTERDERDGIDSYISLTRRHINSNPEDHGANQIFGHIKIIDHKNVGGPIA